MMESFESNQDIHLLVVDDEISVAKIISRFLKSEGYRCDIANSGREALELLAQREYLLTISDINMPGMTGVELLQRVSAKYPKIAFIMLTALGSAETAVQCLKIGAYDYLTKPVDDTELILSVARALERRRLLQWEQEYHARLAREVAEKTKELRETVDQLEVTQGLLTRTQQEIIYRLAVAAEYRDEDTWTHLRRISRYCAFLSCILSQDDKFCATIKVASPLHDIGKIGIPDSILLKPGQLSDEEFQFMRTHTTIGGQILQDSNSPLIQAACEIAANHHERWDGAGYPNKKSKREIPLTARITAICDVFDALTSKRPYKEAWNFERSFETICKERGRAFDPAIIDAVATHRDDLHAVYLENQAAETCDTAPNVSEFVLEV